MDFWLQPMDTHTIAEEENPVWVNRPRTPRRRDENTARRRRRLEEPREQSPNVDIMNGYEADDAFRAFLQYSRDRHAPLDARRAVAGPDAYRIFRGWQIQREDRLQWRIGYLTQQPEVLAQVYGIDPARTDRFRMYQLDSELQRELREDGFPLDRIRQMREIAPNSVDTRIFDELERTSDINFGLAYYPEYRYSV